MIKKNHLLVLGVLVAMFISVSAHAQLCELPVTANTSYNNILVDKIPDLFIDYITQEKNFAKDKLSRTAQREVSARMDEFDENNRTALTSWWENLFPALKKMTQQLHIARLEQTRQIAMMLDAESMNETLLAMQNQEAEARERYRPTATACQIDTLGPAAVKAEDTARALSRSFGLQDASRRANNKTSTAPGAAMGSGAEQGKLWDEYVRYFCDPAQGDQGCTTAGLLAGQHKNLPALLWGDRQTIDMNNPDNMRVVNATTRFIVSPKVFDNVPPSVVPQDSGQKVLLQRRAYNARANAVYNVLGQMLGERAGGSGANTQAIRTEANVVSQDAAINASYREIQTAMNKNRFNADYIQKMLDNPTQMIREQGGISALRLQQLNDLYKRMEEMVFMEAAVYAAELDQRIPQANLSNLPGKN